MKKWPKLTGQEPAAEQRGGCGVGRLEKEELGREPVQAGGLPGGGAWERLTGVPEAVEPGIQQEPETLPCRRKSLLSSRGSSAGLKGRKASLCSCLSPGSRGWRTDMQTKGVWRGVATADGPAAGAQGRASGPVGGSHWVPLLRPAAKPPAPRPGLSTPFLRVDAVPAVRLVPS